MASCGSGSRASGRRPGAWIFLIGPVTASLASLLMVRHYIETILLPALALAAWAGALRRFPGRGAWSLAGLSAGLYFAACMAKELAVPLFVLLPFLPPPGTRQVSPERLRLALPHAAAFAVYLVLRYAVLGTLLGGYGFAVRPSDLPALALTLPGSRAEFVAGRSRLPRSSSLSRSPPGSPLFFSSAAPPQGGRADRPRPAPRHASVPAGRRPGWSLARQCRPGSSSP